MIDYLINLCRIQHYRIHEICEYYITVEYRKTLFSEWRHLTEYGLVDANGDDAYPPIYMSLDAAQQAIIKFDEDIKRGIIHKK